LEYSTTTKDVMVGEMHSNSDDNRGSPAQGLARFKASSTFEGRLKYFLKRTTNQGFFLVMIRQLNTGWFDTLVEGAGKLGMEGDRRVEAPQNDTF
jgi:hypothetical protein